MKIETGAAESHETALPLNEAQSPAHAGQTPAFPSGTMQGGVCDTVGQQQERLSAAEAAISAAQTSGMAAEMDRRNGYHADVLPAGASYGDAMVLPEVPAFVSPPAQSWLYPFQGDEPTPAG
jgi:hypothetical protein